MKRGLLIRKPAKGWASTAFCRLLPGAHAAVFGTAACAAEAEDAGFVIRDCILVVGRVVERVWLLRRPISEPTVAQQVLKTGTGALNISGCRIRSSYTAHELRPNAGHHNKTLFNSVFNGFDLSADKCTSDMGYHNSQGRWPPNLLIVHSKGCRKVGQQEDALSVIVERGGGKSVSCYGDGLHNNRLETQATTIDVWECEPGCPAPVLDQQSGCLPSSYRRARTGSPDPRDWGMKNDGEPFGHQDAGGASRFFPQFSTDDELDIWLLTLLGAESP